MSRIKQIWTQGSLAENSEHFELWPFDQKTYISTQFCEVEANKSGFVQDIEKQMTFSEPISAIYSRCHIHKEIPWPWIPASSSYQRIAGLFQSQVTSVRLEVKLRPMRGARNVWLPQRGLQRGSQRKLMWLAHIYVYSLLGKLYIRCYRCYP